MTSQITTPAHTSDLKKFTMDMPAEMHKNLKMIAAANDIPVRELIIEAVRQHTFKSHQ